MLDPDTKNRPDGKVDQHSANTLLTICQHRLTWLATLAREIVVPSTCLSCHAQVQDQGALCARCWSSVHFIARPYCDILGKPFSVEMGKDAICPEAIADPPPFTRLRSVAEYGDVARSLVSGLKFSDRTDLAPWMAHWMQVAGKEMIAETDLVTSVPLHRRRLLSRRFNQSAELARHLAIASQLPFDPVLLVRKRHTNQQVGLTASERERNVRGAFIVKPEKRPEIAGRNILLIDDVYTTGATVKAVSKVLKRAGAGNVNVLTFAIVGTQPI